MDDLKAALRQRKTTLLNTIEAKINTYIISTKKNCIALVERDSSGKVCCSWDFSDDLDDFFKRLYLFMRKKKAPSGRVLDSALTDPIIEIVKIEYQNFYQNESEAISKGMLTALAADDIELMHFVDRISDIALQKISKEAKSKIVHLIVDQIKESINQGALHGVGNQISHVASTTAGTQVAHIVAHLLIKLLAANIGTAVAKVLASAALQHVLAVIAKKFILAAVTAAVFQFLTVHFGAALAGVSFMWIVLPIIASYIAYKIVTFPKELGEAVSKNVRKELERNFEDINDTVLEKIFSSVFEGNELVDAIAKDPEFSAVLRKLAEKVEPTSASGMKIGSWIKGDKRTTVNVREIRGVGNY